MMVHMKCLNWLGWIGLLCLCRGCSGRRDDTLGQNDE